MKFFYIVLAIFIGAPIFSFAQKDDGKAKDPLFTYNKLDEYKTFLDDVTRKNVDKLDKKIRKEYNEILREKNEALITTLKESNYLFDPSISTYLNSIFNYIVEKNGLDKNAFHFFVSRAPEVNAYTFEEGTIVCNIGLLRVMETESQVAMVLCHEIAHYLLNHPGSSIISFIEKCNEPEFIAQIKEIKKEKYNTKKQLEDLLKVDMFNQRRHNRSQETAADSLGMILLSKTSYGGATVPRLYTLLDSSETLGTTCTIRSFCEKANIATEESWFVTKKKMTFGMATKKEMIDTLKTHPDCAKRKIYADIFFAKNPKPGTDFVLATKEQVEHIKEQAAYAEAAYAKDKEALSYYLYLLIQNDVKYPANKLIKTEIFSTLISFCQKLKHHTLGAAIGKPYVTEDDKDEFAKLLKMLDAADIDKLKEITTKYYETYKNNITLNNELSSNFNELKKY